jgi:hypothetical protein
MILNPGQLVTPLAGGSVNVIRVTRPLPVSERSKSLEWFGALARSRSRPRARAESVSGRPLCRALAKSASSDEPMRTTDLKRRRPEPPRANKKSERRRREPDRRQSRRGVVRQTTGGGAPGQRRRKLGPTPKICCMSVDNEFRPPDHENFQAFQKAGKISAVGVDDVFQSHSW